MFSFFKKKDKAVEKVQLKAVLAAEAIPDVTDMADCPRGLYLSNDERRIAIKYGMTYEQFAEMRKELRSARKIGRPAGAKNKKRRPAKKKTKP